jgi:hypothetical protein
LFAVLHFDLVDLAQGTHFDQGNGSGSETSVVVAFIFLFVE